MKCSKCAASTLGRRKFCGQCGAPMYRHARWYHALVLSLGLLVALEGLSALLVPFIIGLPMIFVAPLAALVIGVQTYRKGIIGPCPYCGAQDNWWPRFRAFKCPTCKQRVLVSDGIFSRVLLQNR